MKNTKGSTTHICKGQPPGRKIKEYSYNVVLEGNLALAFNFLFNSTTNQTSTISYFVLFVICTEVHAYEMNYLEILYCLLNEGKIRPMYVLIILSFKSLIHEKMFMYGSKTTNMTSLLRY